MFEDAGGLARVIDHSLLRPDATLDEVAGACASAREYGFAALIVNGCHVARARSALAGSGVKVGAVVGFPLGASTTTVKIVEAMEAMKNGAEELDIMINIGLARSGRMDLVEIDLKNVITMTKGVLHKAILETSAFTADELGELCRIAVRSGAEFIKTGSGFGVRGVTAGDVALLRKNVGAGCRIKAAGGVRDLAALKALVEAGAERIGTSAGPAIVEEYRRLGGTA